MSKNLNKDIIGMNTEDLQNELVASKMKLTKLKFNHTISPLDNTNVIKEEKKNVARISTELRSRQLNQA